MRRGLIYLGLTAVVAIIVTVLLLKFPKDEGLQNAVLACVVIGSAAIGVVGQMLATRDTRPQVTRLSVEEPVSLNFTDSDGLDPPEVTGPSIKFACNSEHAHVQLSARLEQRQKSIGPLPRWQLIAKAHASLRAGPTGSYGPEELWMEIELLSRPRPLVGRQQMWDSFRA